MRARMLAIAGMVAAGLAACGSSAPGTAGTATATRTHSGAPAATGASPAVATPPAVGSACPPAGRRVSTAAELGDALGAATPGSSIVLAAGVYSGRFVASVPGTAAAPITLCGPATAVIDGGGIDSGYALHLDGASWWRVLGIGVRGGQKGVVLDHADHVLLSGMSVEGTGDEAVHLRAFSSDDTVEGLTIRQTGLLTPKFGEGIYVGSAKSNWCTYTACSPDACDDDVVRGNDIASTTAENIDVKEGTTGGVIAGNRLDGAGMVASAASAWVNVKGNSWTVQPRPPKRHSESHWSGVGCTGCSPTARRGAAVPLNIRQKEDFDLSRHISAARPNWKWSRDEKWCMASAEGDVSFRLTAAEGMWPAGWAMVVGPQSP